MPAACRRLALRNWFARFGTLFLGFAFLASLPAARGADKPGLSGKEIYQRALKSTVWIAVPVAIGNGRFALSSGSGSVIDTQKRIILTNFHVVGEQDSVKVFFPQFDRANKLIAVKDHYIKQLQTGGGLQGKVIARDQKRDLALIEIERIPAGTPAVTLSREGVGPGDSVHSLGNPGASDALWAYTPGSVKSVYPKQWSVADPMNRKQTYQYSAQVVETTSPVNPGDSGGPLLNNQGELVAVTQGGITTQGTISFFIDISEVRNFLAERKIRVTNAPVASVAASSEAPAGSGDGNAAAAQQEREEKAAAAKLALAQQFVKDRPEKARERLEEIITNFPKTKAAQQARELLAKLKL